MLPYSRGASLLLAFSIAAVTTAFLSLFDAIPGYALAAAFFIAFGSAYILTLAALEFFIFREINKINAALKKLKDEDLSFISSASEKSSNPFKKINEDIYNYAAIKQQEIEELKKLATFRREFLADVSHELKTPIFAAQGFVLTLLDGAIKDKSVRIKFLKKAAKSLEGLEMLLEDLLTISQMETGEIKMNFSPFDICEITREVFDQFEEQAEEKNIQLAFAEGTPDAIMAYGDAQRIYQVMSNLISNAVKYTPENGRVEVFFEAGKQEVSTFVKDTGIGIPPQDIKRIFERFYRVEKSRSKEKGGTGLGLAIVKHILEAHQSKVTVASSPGQGSVFSFKLKKPAEKISPAQRRKPDFLPFL